jgi:uncharacterized membrane protein (Fun14 family)
MGLGQHILLGIVVGYVAPRATQFTGHFCWFMRGLGQHTLLGIVVGYAMFWATHLLGIIVGLIWGAINGFKIILFLSNSIKVDVSVSVSLSEVSRWMCDCLEMLIQRACDVFTLFRIAASLKERLAQVSDMYGPRWSDEEGLRLLSLQERADKARVVIIIISEDLLGSSNLFEQVYIMSDNVS